MKNCMFGTSQEDFLDAFMQYISKTNAATLKAALKDVNPVNQSYFHIFTQYELKRVPIGRRTWSAS